MSYREVLPHSKSKPPFQLNSLSELQELSHVLRLSLNVSTWLALGATLQACLVILPVPKLYTLAPGVLFLLYRVLHTVLVTYEIVSNPYLKGVIPYRYTALVPDKYGNFPAPNEAPNKEKIAILLLCAKINHPAGWLAAPHVQKFGDLFSKMNNDLKKLPQAQSGLLGHSGTYMPSANGTTEVVNISYWRSKEHILKYADSPAHREAVRWWTDLDAYDGNGGKVKHIGISHEIFESQPGCWESVYMGYQPTLLGATSYLKPGIESEKGSIPDEWISPIIEARRGKLAGSRGRLGLSPRSKRDEGIMM